MSACVLHHARTITVFFNHDPNFNKRLSVGSSPALSSGGMSQKKNNPVFSLTLLKLSRLLFSLNQTIVRHRVVVSTVEAIHSCK